MAELRELQDLFVRAVNVAWQRTGRPPVQVTSYVRSPARNVAVGGATDSQHLLGLAADFKGPVQRFAAELRSIGLVVIDYGSHVHVQLLPAGLARRAGLFEQAGLA